jgi:hypothetical protein
MAYGCAGCLVKVEVQEQAIGIVFAAAKAVVLARVRFSRYCMAV